MAGSAGVPGVPVWPGEEDVCGRQAPRSGPRRWWPPPVQQGGGRPRGPWLPCRPGAACAGGPWTARFRAPRTVARPAAVPPLRLREPRRQRGPRPRCQILGASGGGAWRGPVRPRRALRSRVVAPFRLRRRPGQLRRPRRSRLRLARHPGSGRPVRLPRGVAASGGGSGLRLPAGPLRLRLPWWEPGPRLRAGRAARRRRGPPAWRPGPRVDGGGGSGRDGALRPRG
jgi:hypothetical protein